MRYLILLFTCFCFLIAQSQKKVPVNLTFEYTDTLTVNEFVWVGQPGLDYDGISLEAMENGYIPYKSFQYLNWLNHKVQLHLEEEDTFTIVLGQDFDEYSFYYAGEVGAIKNNYILDRVRLLQELETDASFQKSNRVQAKLLLEQKKDSMLSIAGSLGLTDSFIKDEKKYWKYYINYHYVFHDVLRNEDLDFTSLDISDFPEMDYDNQEDHFNYRDYLKLSLAYHYLKINSLQDYDSMKDAVKDIDSRVLKFSLISTWADQIYKRNSLSEDYMRLVNRFSNSPSHYRSVKDIYNKRNRLTLGDPFPFPETTDFYDKPIVLEKAKGKPAYILIYAPEDEYIDNNFLKWNQFYLQHRDEDARFITIGLGTDRVKAVFKDVFLNSQIAGSHLSTSPREARNILENLSIGYVPTVIKIDESGNIIDFNVNANLKKLNPFQSRPIILRWRSELGKSF
ncbi:hypothetical protein [Nonlabens sp. Asnod3-H03]|uniref:hypothetical protein n=1 Tax=Nonlabens sp. Asnod3-H03 TaxID=3160580 RepID=UPI0038658064